VHLARLRNCYLLTITRERTQAGAEYAVDLVINHMKNDNAPGEQVQTFFWNLVELIYVPPVPNAQCVGDKRTYSNGNYTMRTLNDTACANGSVFCLLA